MYNKIHVKWHVITTLTTSLVLGLLFRPGCPRPGAGFAGAGSVQLGALPWTYTVSFFAKIVTLLEQK